MRRKYKKFISMLLTMAVAITSASALNAFAADTDTNNASNDGDVVIEVNDTVLVKDVDYTLEYEDNVNVGTGKVIVHFIGNYSGEKEQTFNIVKKSSGGGGGGGSATSQDSTNITVTDKNGQSITVTKKENGDTVTITLPNDKKLSDDNPYTIVVTDKKGNPVEKEVVLKDKNGNEASGTTDKDGKITLPAIAEVTPSPAPTSEPEEYDHYAYIRGYEDGSFMPDGKITRAETAAMLNGVIESENTDKSAVFSDLAAGAWYIPAINAMSATGIINGYTDGTFRPDNEITRAEFVTMLMQNQFVETFSELPFDDVSSELWSADYIYSAYKAGYIDGYDDGTFKPDNPITRAESVKIINSVLGRTDMSNTKNPFADVKDTHWAYKQILEAAIDHNAE